MSTLTGPHVQSSESHDPNTTDLDPNQMVADVGQGDDADLYKNAAGAQTAGSRSFHANADRSNLSNSEPFTAAMDGGTDTRTPQSPNQGITNHSASEESARQAKVVSERPDALAGVDQVGHAVPK